MYILLRGEYKVKQRMNNGKKYTPLWQCNKLGCLRGSKNNSIEKE